MNLPYMPIPAHVLFAQVQTWTRRANELDPRPSFDRHTREAIR